jgi:hypothetical protein
MIQVLIAGLIVALIEGLLVWAFLTSAIAPAPALGLHCALILLLFVWTYGAKRFDADRTWPLLLSATTAVMGPVGPAGALSTMGLTLLYRRSARPFEEWYAAIFPEVGSQALPGLPDNNNNSFSTAASGVSAFADVLAFGTIAEKQELLVLIAKQFRPAFAPALKLALRDSSNAIRVQAASAVTKLEDDYTRRSVQLSQSLGQTPNAAELLNMAVHYEQYAATGLLDSTREAAARRSALDAYERYLKIESGNVEACAAYGRLLLQEKETEKARVWLESCVRSRKRSPQIVLLYMEALFDLGDYSKLRETAGQNHAIVSRRAAFLDESCEAVRFWAGKTV